MKNNDNEDDFDPSEGENNPKNQPENSPEGENQELPAEKEPEIGDFMTGEYPEIEAFLDSIFAGRRGELWDEASSEEEIEEEETEEIEWEQAEGWDETADESEIQAFEVEAESEEMEENEAEEEIEMDEEELELYLKHLEKMREHLEDKETDSERLKTFKRLLREKLDSLKAADDRVEEARIALEQAREKLNMHMEQLMGKLQAILDSIPKKVRVFELGIPDEDLKNYREKLTSLQENPIEDANPYAHFQPLAADADIELSRSKLLQISNRGDVEAFRFLQQLEKEIPSELRGWTRAALLQAQTQMLNNLSDDNIPLISSGLGGAEDLVRHICYIPSAEVLSEGRALFIRQEFENQAVVEGGKLETFSFAPHCVTMQILLPFLHHNHQFAKNALENCQFLTGDFWISCLKDMSETEFNEWLAIFIKNNPTNLSYLFNSDENL